LGLGAKALWSLEAGELRRAQETSLLKEAKQKVMIDY
jgi:hypothetical protein